ncbi:N-acetylmuramoyl-L-alanine amidase [Paenibacillus spiritus]|uniref:N-acetylmuramoyl-L-alanine amidase n=1 Tax=Paenibacillus spiritus TaxID=2496557 RepID=A0A5J5GGW5_9BACL|nr:N-acetylmuramoyl-L-alanine amidase [Paenibacillus spiritus]KAA9007401.1 N-acetylmuramoyl-L-alanine amidase [Paenibacillus spiritus]
MSFTMKYEIIPKYLTCGTKRRSGIKIPSVKFLVAHDTGNPNSSALGNINYYENSKNDESASAHIFLDDKAIYECIPALTGTPEKAWHVLYNKTKDNELFGCNANDAAIGVEYCYGSKINSGEAYKRYVWVLAYTCYKFGLDPGKHITGHFILDPERKTDPKSGLAASGRTFEQLIKDVVNEYKTCSNSATLSPSQSIPSSSSPITIKAIFTSDNSIIEGILKDGSSHIPVSSLKEKLGDVVTWDNVNKELKVNNIVVDAYLKDGVNYISASGLTKLGHKITWDNANKKLYISK